MPTSNERASERQQFDVAVVTSAALPWRTGPAFLSLWHACGLSELGLNVAYIIPWLDQTSQQRVWGEICFETPEEQFTWLAAEAERIGCPPLPATYSYCARYITALRSAVPVQDVFTAVPASRVIVLEEPEHLCWYPLTRSRRKIAAKRVIGLLLTNYGYYVRHTAPPGLGWLGSLVGRYHSHLIKRHTDLVVPLSPAVNAIIGSHPYRETPVTGVLSSYAEVPPVARNSRGIYFLGRLVWDKGLSDLIELSRRLKLTIDVYGDGPDAAAIEKQSHQRGALLRFHGASSAPWELLENYRVFLNPSRSEVLCTATADALVAGRHVVLPQCPANQPFLRYPNSHAYHDLDDAEALLLRALKEQPKPPEAARHNFDWRNACRRLAGLCADSPLV